jgi:hypothetical protein
MQLKIGKGVGIHHEISKKYLFFSSYNIVHSFINVNSRTV